MSLFPQSELTRALSEQTFGIKGYTIESSTSLESIARVSLLEGNEVEISLTTRGFAVINGPERVYETVDDALHAISPLYRDAKLKSLFEGLARLPRLDERIMSD